MSVNTWQNLGQDIYGEFAGDRYGFSVSLSADGRTVAIGAAFNDGNGVDSGSVRVYQLDASNNWQQLGQDIDGEAAYDSSGFSVSLSADGRRVAIGAVYNDGNGANSGSVRIYQLNASNNWQKIGQDIDGEAAYDRFGRAVTLSADGNRLAVGAFLNDGNGGDSGSVRVYQLDASNNWQQLGQDIDGEFGGDRSGLAMSLSADGRRVAVGAYLNSGSNNLKPDSGSVRVYQLDASNNWQQLGQDIDGEATGDWSGYYVSLSADGNRVAIGAPYNDDNEEDSGSVRVYQLDASNNWQQLGQDIDGEATGERSGYSVSLSADGTRVAIGASLNDDNGQDSGSVRVYKLDASNNWQQLGLTIHGEEANDNFGHSLSLSVDGKRVAIGAISDNGPLYGEIRGLVGSVRVYELVTEEVIPSNICFPRGTPISTNQGIVPIEKLNPSIHTIRNKKIVAITKTMTQEKHLVCFEKNALGENIPSQKTAMTRNHRVFYNGKMIEAKKFIGKVENVNNINYSGEILYNVLMEKSDKMVVNNLICETLDPENCVAKLYTYFKDFKPSEQQMVLKKVNEYAETKFKLPSKK